WKRKKEKSQDKQKGKKYKPVVLLVLDGFGVNPDVVDSPWCLAKRPNFNEMEKFWPFLVLQASGISVGLPWQEPGNSEVGHLTMGAGRVVYTALPRISNAIEDGSFFANPVLLQAMEKVKRPDSSLHLIGLFSSGTVHGYFEHFFAVLELAKKHGLDKVFLHLFTDGKDSPKQEAGGFLEKQTERLQNAYPAAKIVSLVGRRFAMDRESRWDLTETAYRLLVEGRGTQFKDPVAYLKEQYLKGREDESLEPGFLAGGDGNPEGRIKDGDTVIFMNFREDSARQLTKVFVDKDFQEFGRKEPGDLLFITITDYDKKLKTLVAFPQPEVNFTLGELIAEQGFSQLRIAETVKYAHVTYFFNGG
ncbi:MAG: 2,3-bisphosphoglycerate-independent phosphoglycerate mutase, partial [Patescibacteria group bacterium]